MIKIITVGAIKEKYLKDAIEEYTKRIKKYTNIELIEVKDEGLVEEGKAIALEAEKIKKNLSPRDYIITLEIEGKQLASEEFAEKLKSNLQYYFWSKAEHEIVISSFPVHIKKEEFNRLTDEFKKDTKRYGHEPYGMWICPDVGIKIDIYEQVMLNFSHVVNYIWLHKRSKDEKTS